MTQFEIALNPYEFRRKFNPRVAMSAYPYAIRCPIFSQIEATFFLPTAAHRRPNQEEKGSTRGGICAQLSKICSLKKYSIVFCHGFYLELCQKSHKNLPWRTFVSKVFFPADVLPRKCQLIFLGRIFVSKVFFFLPTSFREMFDNFLGRTSAGDAYFSCRRPSRKVFTKIWQILRNFMFH